MQKQSGIMCPVLFVLLALALAGPATAATRTWLGTTDTNWNTAANWSDGAVPTNTDAVVIPDAANDPTMPAGTYPADGAFASFELQAGATNTCLGDTNVINEASGGVDTNKHGIGVTINVSGNVTIAGSLNANWQGFPTGIKGPGKATYVWGGAGYGGIGAHTYGGINQGSATYGSLTQPTALGSSGAGAGGGAIKLSVGGTLDITGEITADGKTGAGPGSGGSVWLIANNLTGNGAITAEGPTNVVTAYGGAGGGRISLEYNTKTFSGTVSAAGGHAFAPRDPTGTGSSWPGQPGTLWEPRRFEGLEGSAGSPVDITFTNNGYQYYFTNTFPTCYWNLAVSREWVEFHGGSLNIGNLVLSNYSDLRLGKSWGGTNTFDMVSLAITGSISLIGTNTYLYLPAEGVYNLSGDLSVGTFVDNSNSVVYAYGNTGAVNVASGGTAGNPHGIGLTINVGGNAAIAGVIDGDYKGFAKAMGPAPGGSGYTPGGGHGGKAALSSYPAYGLLTQPTALGSGGATLFLSDAFGGGAVKLNVAGTLTLDGTIKVRGQDRSNGSGAAGGSIWLIANTFAGAGSLLAYGGIGGGSYGGGGGGRIALEYSTSTFTGTISMAGGAAGTPGQTGTWFQCESPFRGTYSTGYQGVSMTSTFSVASSSNGIKIARTVSKWGRVAACWTELSTDYNDAQLNNVATNSFSGLLPNERYRVYDNGALMNVLTSTANGSLSFAVTLTNGAHSIRVEGPAGAIMTVR